MKEDRYTNNTDLHVMRNALYQRHVENVIDDGGRAVMLYECSELRVRECFIAVVMFK